MPKYSAASSNERYKRHINLRQLCDLNGRVIFGDVGIKNLCQYKRLQVCTVHACRIKLRCQSFDSANDGKLLHRPRCR